MSTLNDQIARHGLNYVMDFDHVIQVHEDGTVTDVPSAGYETWEPEFTGDTATGETTLSTHPCSASKWQNFGGRYTSQYGVNDILHNCESVGAGLERDILATPGFYVAVYCTWTPDDDAFDEDEDTVEGWTVAYKEAL